ncbi:MAG TPA: NAD(P)H-hydrate dehydratase [Blastocatellia bacterium]|nr:NAD(P)H-hydrate dehydratase [Blastocatellia bacterium]
MKILTAQQMREMDRLTVEQAGISYATLMETAGSRVVEAIVSCFGEVAGKSFLVVCGKGNNGGDGAVIARGLWLRGAFVKVRLHSRLTDTQDEARANFEAVRQLASSRQLLFEDDEQSYHPARLHPPRLKDEQFNTPDFIVDALFGTGLTRPVEGKLAQAISRINDYRKHCASKVVAVDIPSGLSSDTGQPLGIHVEADLTVTFTAPKFGNVLPPASTANGKLLVAPIGTPDWLLEEECPSDVFLIGEGQITEWLIASRRRPEAHKNSVGDVLLIAGSRGKTGAAALAAESILRAGAGLVTVATAHSAQSILVNQTRLEVMTEALPETESSAISEQALERVLQLAAKKTVLAIGPGLSSEEESTRRFVLELLRQRTSPIVIDADGLNALAPWPEDLKGSAELPIIITPHPGEMARLTGKTNTEIVADRVGIAREFANKHRVVVLLKGSRTVIAGSYSIQGDEQLFSIVYVDPTGNAGMATAGSGDVLTGLISGLLAQRPEDALEATIAGVYLHGLAGDLAAAKLGMRSLVASDIIANLSEAILQVGGEEEKGAPSVIRQI